MGNIQLDSSTHFVVDYRSAPMGIGTIFFSTGRNILVTESSCGPKDMKEAIVLIKEEYLPTEVANIKFDMGENWDEGNLALGKILCQNDVQYVVDSELAYEFESLTENMHQRVFTIQNWLKLRNLKEALCLS